MWYSVTPIIHRTVIDNVALQGSTLFIGNQGINALKLTPGAWTVPIL